MEIYKAPKAHLGNDDEKSSNIGQCLVSSTLGTIASLVYLAPYRLIPQFAETFESFGNEVPRLTSVFLAIQPIFLALAIVSLSLNLAWLFRLPKPESVYKISKFSAYNLGASFFVIVRMLDCHAFACLSDGASNIIPNNGSTASAFTQLRCSKAPRVPGVMYALPQRPNTYLL